jgi:cysteinyl-tRNA synthetase
VKNKYTLLLSCLFGFCRLIAQTGLSDVTSWAYQLQDVELTQIIENPSFQLFVMDYSSDGSDAQKYTSQQIAQIQAGGKKVLAYISIGEAEDYRFYWNPAWNSNPPDWLGPENPDWEGNYKVRFWIQEWQDIVFAYIDTVLAQGFDGIYCDIIDAYYYWSEEVQSEPMADAYMVQFVLNIRDHISQKTEEDFFIVPQNGEFIIEEVNVTSTMKNDYLSAIQGIGVEDVFFPGDEDEDNDWDPDDERVNMLSGYLAHGLPVFSIEYLTHTDKIQQYIAAARTAGYVPYVSTRALDTLYDGIHVFAEHRESGRPNSFKLYQNFPNPFNSHTWITVWVESGPIQIVLYNTSGHHIRTLTDSSEEPGCHTLRWDGTDEGGSPVASGIYFYSLFNGRQLLKSRRMVLQK